MSENTGPASRSYPLPPPNGTEPIQSSPEQERTPIFAPSKPISRPMSPKRAKSFDVKLMHTTKGRLSGQGGDTPVMSVKRQHSEPAANKFDVLRKSFYNRTNSVKTYVDGVD